MNNSIPYLTNKNRNIRCYVRIDETKEIKLLLRIIHEKGNNSFADTVLIISQLTSDNLFAFST